MLAVARLLGTYLDRPVRQLEADLVVVVALERSNRMQQSPQLTADAPWRKRFRAPQTWFLQIAQRAPERGLINSNRSGVFQIYAWDISTGNLTQITHHLKGKPWGVLAPDGRFVYYFEDQDGNELGHWVRIPFEGGPAEDITPDLPPYASWFFSQSLAGNRAGLTIVDQDGFHIVVMDMDADGNLSGRREIYRTDKMAGGPQLSADGQLAVVETAERSDKPQFSLIAFDLATGERSQELWDGPETSVAICGFAPVHGDDRVLAVSNRSGDKRPLIWHARSGERRDLELPQLAGEVEAWGWSPDAKEVLLCHVHQAVQQLYIYELASGSLRRLDHPGGSYFGAVVTGDNEVVSIWNDAVNPFQVVALDAGSGARTRVVVPSADIPAGRPWRSVSFPSSDGTSIQAWLALPEGIGPFPTILHTHGGPTSVMMESFDAGSQMWLDHGFAYLTINYRGSTTFGKAFEEQIIGDIGYWEVEDLVAARDWLLREGIAQADAILLTGWSYGGYLTLMGLGTRPDLWAGGMAGIAVADWTIQHEDSAPTLRGYLEALFRGSPAAHPEQYARSSPISYVGQVRAPVLVIQGRNDTRCPARPVEIYEARLRELGKQIEVDWFEAGHGSYETEQQIAHHELMLRFACRVLG
jgi:dipeptidyl aminopeptidase/acylaminoacyl peptidase